MKETLVPCKLSPDCMRHLTLKKLDFVLENQRKLTYCESMDIIADLRDEIEKFF